jgi:hypothetical protein
MQFFVLAIFSHFRLHLDICYHSIICILTLGFCTSLTFSSSQRNPWSYFIALSQTTLHRPFLRHCLPSFFLQQHKMKPHSPRSSCLVVSSILESEPCSDIFSHYFILNHALIPLDAAGHPPLPSESICSRKFLHLCVIGITTSIMLLPHCYIFLLFDLIMPQPLGLYLCSTNSTILYPCFTFPCSTNK